MQPKVDLSQCKKGDILISKHGAILRYLEPLNPEIDYYDHRVEYLFIFGEEVSKGNRGTRNNDGTTYKNKRLETDHDIVSVISKEQFKKLFK